MSPDRSRSSSPWLDESAGFAVPAATREGARLHRCQRGNVSLLVLFMGLVFYAVIAMTWNTGEVTAAKIETQTAADSAAYTSAVWTSRAVNVVAATNQLALRDASALGVAVAVGIEGIWILAWEIYYFAQYIAPLFSGLPWTAPALAAQLAIWGADMAQFVRFIVETGWPVLPIIDAILLGIHLDTLMAYQSEWIRVLPGLIGDQHLLVEAYYDCDVRLLRGDGSTSIEAPLHAGTPLTCLVPFFARYLYDALAKGSWYDDPHPQADPARQGQAGVEDRRGRRWSVRMAGTRLQPPRAQLAAALLAARVRAVRDRLQHELARLHGHGERAQAPRQPDVGAAPPLPAALHGPRPLRRGRHDAARGVLTGGGPSTGSTGSSRPPTSAASPCSSPS